MDKIFKESVKTAYNELRGKSLESLLNDYEVASVDRSSTKRDGTLLNVCINYTLRVPLSVGGFILVDFFDEEEDSSFGEWMIYEPIKGHKFCIILCDYDGTPDEIHNCK